MKQTGHGCGLESTMTEMFAVFQSQILCRYVCSWPRQLFGRNHVCVLTNLTRKVGRNVKSTIDRVSNICTCRYRGGLH